MTPGLLSPPKAVWLRLPRHERLALIFAALVAAATAATFLTGTPGLVGITMAVLLCLLAAASGRWTVPAGVAVGVLLCVEIVVPEEQSFAVVAGLVPVSVCAARGFDRAKAWFTGWFLLALGLEMMVKSRATSPVAAVVEVVPALLFFLVLFAMAWLIGHNVRSEERRHVDAQQERMGALRRDIAQDLHDTVAYSLSVIAIRADQARLHGAGTVEDLSFIADSSRRAIGDLRGIMTVLRRSVGVGDQPTWSVEPLAAVIERKARELRDSGFAVEASVDGDLDELPRSVHDTLAKVLHEALSNVGRHAEPRSACALILTVTPNEAEVAVLSELPEMGRGTREDALGVIGMRERVTGINGTFSAGPVGNRWVVQASIPLSRP